MKVKLKNNGGLTILISNVLHHIATSDPDVGLYTETSFV